MSTSRPPLRARWVRTWVRLYTAGMPPESRDARREEMESDFWEHERQAETALIGAVDFQIQMFVRWVTGLRDDLEWRIVLAVRGAGRPTSDEITADPPRAGKLQRIEERLVRGFAGVAAILCVSAVAGTMLGHAPTMNEANAGAAVTMLLAGGLLMSGGRVLLRRGPYSSAVLLAIGAVVFGIAWQWTVLLPVMAAVMGVLGLHRAITESRKDRRNDRLKKVGR